MSRKFEDLIREINSPYLDEALELDGEARERWLEELEKRLPAVAAAVRSSLGELERLQEIDFLGGAGPHTSMASHEGGLIGRRIGAYVIDAEIGRGGMGSVWRAKRADGRFEGYVAIKFIHLSHLGHAVEQRFKLEGRLLARLNHPSIARLIDAGVVDGAHPYIVIEYVDGEPIDVYCERRALALEARILLFLDVLAAVAHAHGRLVVHRDLKPSNVFVTEGGAVKLLDFGIAKLLEEGDELAELTLVGPSALTPRYAAPEQLLGQPVTTATDVYTLGLLLYVLLAGVHPISPQSHSRAEQIQEILATELPRPSLMAVGAPAHRRALEGDLDNILAKALKKSPSERYLSVSAFADDLRRFLNHEPVQARPDTTTYRFVKFLRRNRAAVLSGALIICGLIAISTFALLQMFSARTQRDLAVYRMKLANAQSDLTAFIVSDTLTGATSDLKRQRLDRARTFVAARFRRDPLIAGRLLIDVSGRYIEIGENKIAAEVTEEAEAIGRRTGDLDYIAQLACIRTQDLAIARDLPAARTQLAKGLSTMGRLREVRPELTAECATAGAFVAQSDGDFAKAIVLLSNALVTLERAGLTDEARYANTRNDLARAFLFAGDFHDAWDVESRTMALVRDAGRGESVAYLAELSVGCSTLRNGGQPRRALELLDPIIVAARRANSEFDLPYYLYGCRALSEIALGRPQDANLSLLRAAQAAEKAGAQSGTYRIAAVTLGIERGDLRAADEAWGLLASEEDRMHVANDRGEGAVRLILTHARLDLAHARVDEALRRVEVAAALVAARHQQSNPDGREVELVWAQACMASGAYSQAEAHARNAVALARAAAVDPDSSAWIGEALVWRARSEAALGKAAAAVRSAREALPHLEANLDPAHPLIAAASHEFRAPSGT